MMHLLLLLWLWLPVACFSSVLKFSEPENRGPSLGARDPSVNLDEAYGPSLRRTFINAENQMGKVLQKKPFIKTFLTKPSVL